MSSVDEVVAVLDDGGLVVIPTDTVYGLACRPDVEVAVTALSELKRRSAKQPIALVGSSAAALRELVPELPEHRLAAGPFTLVLPNPRRRLPWLTGSRPDTVGVRLPEMDGAAAEILRRVGAVAATSANLHGGVDPRRLDDVPAEIVAGVAATLDGGELPGAPSTVIDLTGALPRILREGAVSADEALRRMSGV